MLEYYHDKLKEIWGAKTISLKNLGGHGPPGPLGSATYVNDRVVSTCYMQ